MNPHDLTIVTRARLLADAMRQAEEFWRSHEQYAQDIAFNEQAKNENDVKAALYATKLRRFETRRDQHIQRAAEAHKLMAISMQFPAEAKRLIVDEVLSHIDVIPAVGRIERHEKISFGMDSPVLHIASGEVRPGEVSSYAERLRRALIRIVPRSNAFSYDIRFRYRVMLRYRDAALLAEAIADIIAACARGAVIAAHDPAKAAGLPLQIEELAMWFPLDGKAIKRVLKAVVAGRVEGVWGFETNNPDPTRKVCADALRAKDRFASERAERICQELEALYARVAEPRAFLRQLPPILKPNPNYAIALRPLVPPRYHGNTKEFWEDLPWETTLSIASSDVPKNRILLGYHPSTYKPVWCTRKQLQAHAHVVGATQSGKTSSALLPIAIQLIRGSDDDQGEPPPILWIDLRGDFTAFNTLRLEAMSRRQTFRHFTTSIHHASDTFDVLGSLASISAYDQTLADIIVQSFDLHHGPGYGPGYFSKVNREAATKAIEAARGSELLESLSGLAEALQSARATKREPGGMRLEDSDELFAALRPFTREPLLSRTTPKQDEHVINMERVVEHREIVYLWGPAIDTTIPDVARLGLYSFLNAASVCQGKGKRRQCYVFIDEFQNVASFNIGKLFEFASAIGVSLIVCNQSRAALTVGRVDVRDKVTTNANLKIDFTCASREDLEELVAMSGERLETYESNMSGEADTEGKSDGVTDGWAERKGTSDSVGTSFSQMWNQLSNWSSGPNGSSVGGGRSQGGGRSESNQHTDSQDKTQSGSTSKGNSSSKTRSYGKTLSTRYRPRLTLDEALDVAEARGACLVRATQQDAGSDLGVRPRAIRALRPITEFEYGVRSKMPPPLLPAGTGLAGRIGTAEQAQPPNQADQISVPAAATPLADRITDYYRGHRDPPTGWPDAPKEG
jgi:hypothetical protein